MALVAILVLGCNDYCDDSARVQINCGAFAPEDTSPCDECIAECVADATCEELKTGAYRACIKAECE